MIRGTRLSVEFIVGLLASGWREAEVFENYPGITGDDITACTGSRYVLDTERGSERLGGKDF